MNLFLEYQKKIFKSLKALEKYKKINIPSTLKIINVDLPPRNQKADLACNAAMILARSNNTSPNLLAEKIKKHLLLNFKEFSILCFMFMISMFITKYLIFMISLDVC